MGQRDYPSQNALSVGDIAAYCLVSNTTVLRWIKKGKLRGFRLPSGHYRIHKEDFRGFLEQYNIPIKQELFESKSKKKGGEK